MRVLPIPFNSPMVRGLLREIEKPATGKTQTRRVLSRLRRFGNIREFGRSDTRGYDWHFRDKDGRFHDLRHAELLPHLPYAVGDRLYVREAWRISKRWDETKPSVLPVRAMTVMFEAGGSVGGIAPYDKAKPRPLAEYAPDLNWPQTMPDWAGKPRPAMFMPRWASRITLTVTEVRVKRLEDICEQDAVAEGVEPERDGWKQYGTVSAYPDAVWDTAIDAYHDLWDSINGIGAWDANPWVAAYTFVPELINIDAWSE